MNITASRTLNTPVNTVHSFFLYMVGPPHSEMAAASWATWMV